MTWLTMALSNWKLIATGLSICALALSILHGRALKAELGEKTAEIDYMRRVATEYSERSEQTAKETSDAFTTLVESIKSKDTALNAARAKFGSCNVAGGITAVGMLRAKDGVGEAYVPESTGRVSQPEYIPVSAEFVNGCASDSAYVVAVGEWRVKNELPIEGE